MGYDLHLTRADDWTESDAHPIPYDEWAAFARAAPGLSADGTLSTTTEAGEVVDQPVYLLGGGPSLYWSDGQVTVGGADEGHVDALRSLAGVLGASLCGDDGEAY